MHSLRNLRTLRSLRHRNFRLLMEGALVSSSGDFMQNIAQSWLVWHVSKSPVAIGVVAFFDTLSTPAGGRLGGAIADRFDRRRVLMITQTAAMIQAIVYWLAVEFEVIELWHIAALAFCSGRRQYDQSDRAPIFGQQSGAQGRVAERHRLAIFGVQFLENFGTVGGWLDYRLCRHRRLLSRQRDQFRVSAFQSLYMMELPPWEKRGG